MTKICKYCKHQNLDIHHYCVKCGKPLETGVALLPKKYVVISEDEYKKLKGQQAQLGTLQQNFKSLQNNYRNLKNQTNRSWGNRLRDWWSDFWTEHGEDVWITLGSLFFLAICFGIGYSFKSCSKDNDNYFVKIVQDENTHKFGLYNEQTKQQVLPCDYDTILHQRGYYYHFFYTRQGALWGVTDSLGNVTVNCSLDSVRTSSPRPDCVLITFANDKQGVISNFGQVILPCEYARVLWDYDMRNHSANVNSAGNYIGNIIPAKQTANGKWELYNRNGERITQNTYLDVQQTGASDLVKVSKDKTKYGLVDINGTEVQKCNYGTIQTFFGDYSWIRVGRPRRSLTDDGADDKWMCIYSDGTILFSFPGNYTPYPFSQGLAAIVNNDVMKINNNSLVGFCDVNGEMVIPMIYNPKMTETGGWYHPSFSDGDNPKAWVSYQGKDGYLTTDGVFHED